MVTENRNRIYLSSPHMSGNEQKYINQAFETNWIAPLGPNVDAFEQEVAAYVGTEGAVALSSGTAAIHMALRLLNVGFGDKVFCSSLTFVASANPILYQGAEPVFIDSEPETWNMSPQALEKALSDACREGCLPKAVIVVHLYGQSARMDEIMDLCNKFGVQVIEDAAESLGSTFKGKASGSMGRFGIYSFNGNKIITTSGGGMLVSNDMNALRRARFLSTQARDQAPHYQHSQLGYNYRMSNLLAGVGRAQLEILEDRVVMRRLIFERYYKELAHLPGVEFMPELNNSRSNRWLTALTMDSPNAATHLIETLAEKNIEARPVWKPLHMQPLFAGSKFYPHRENENVSQRLFHLGICLPSGSNMTEKDQERVIQSVKDNYKVYFRL